MNCPKCGGPIQGSTDDHRCAYVMHLEPASLSIAGQPIGLVVEGPPDAPGGRRVVSTPASGGRLFSAHRCGRPRVQRRIVRDSRQGSGQRVPSQEILVAALRAGGRNASLASGGRDDRGEDGVLMLDGTRVGLQVVSVPVAAKLLEGALRFRQPSGHRHDRRCSGHDS